MGLQTPEAQSLGIANQGAHNPTSYLSQENSILPHSFNHQFQVQQAGGLGSQQHLTTQTQQVASAAEQFDDSRVMNDLLKDYGVREHTISRMEEEGFNLNTLLSMNDEEVAEAIKMMISECGIKFLVGERFGVKMACRSGRKWLEEKRALLENPPAPQSQKKRKRLDGKASQGVSEHVLASLVNGGLGNESEEADEETVQKQSELSGRTKSKTTPKKKKGEGDEATSRGPAFQVTAQGEDGHGKKQGLDYLFELYGEAGRILEEIRVQEKATGKKPSAKVNNLVYRYAKQRGMGFINKPKMRQYLHCYALHCLDPGTSNAIRMTCRDRKKTLQAWAECCYEPLLQMARVRGYNLESLFQLSPQLAIWNVPKQLEKLCEEEKDRLGELGSGQLDQQPLPPPPRQGA
ncbi:LEAFY-like protein [Klebsormidium nitens]|uniref:Floricaula/leafy-like transcription factor n=1 Tax=Klebsormidium nitens TaxID=105231 RepID=A0A1Y1IRK2_KLENI|nr:LEAFY-like protein [Klebsormidium nitens]|eukprot:GAQ91366.1 LEAFY-like protein [Klebsormidium nitens]